MNFNKIYETDSFEIELKYILRNNENFLEVIKENNYYEYHYFLSHLRHDLFNWYPFKKEANLLEIGSSYGQLTSFFTQKVNNVVAIENTKFKANIVSKRVNDAKVIVSDFDKIEIDEKFDYIILCNTFEYAKSFYDNENPYENYLKYLRRFLKKDGVILIALSNRLGLKYFAGFKEEHTNQFFSGIDGYNNIDYVETFSKTELVNLIKSSGFSNYKFFYPYPDHIFPLVISTDKFVNKMPYERKTDYFDERCDFFREDVLNQTLAKDNLADYFSNSFLVEIRNSEIKFPTDDIDFVKINSNRNEEFRTLTTINSNGFVYKSPLSKKSINHVKNMYDGSKFQLGKITYLDCDLKEDSICYKFLEEKSLEDYILDAIFNNDISEFFRLLEEYYEKLFYNSFESRDYAEGKFLDIFKIKSDKMFHCHDKSNLDLIFSNIFFIGEEYVAIDYEWIFDFPIPLEYIFYRVLLHHTRANEVFNDFITIEEIFNYFDLDTSNFNLFRNWDANFMKYVFSNDIKPKRNIISNNKFLYSENSLKINSNEQKNDSSKRNIIVNQKNMIEKKNKEIRDKDNLINNKNIEIEQKNNKINEFQNSTSWKITEPLRKIRSFFK